MEADLRAALIAWLAADTTLSAQLNAITEEAPSKTALPWLAIATSASIDWSCKDRLGREVRSAWELSCRGDRPATAAALVRAIEARIVSLPAAQDGFEVISCQFLRARSEQRPGNLRSVLTEYRFRVLTA